MTESTGIGKSGDYEEQLVEQLRVFGDALEDGAPEFDVSAGEARLRNAAQAAGFVDRPAPVPEATALRAEGELSSVRAIDAHKMAAISAAGQTPPSRPDDHLMSRHGDGVLPLNSPRANFARVYNYWLGGKENFAVDRRVAENARSVNPEIVNDVLAHRAFLARAVRYLVSECGVRQFLDIGTGLPTAGCPHQVAQQIAPDARIVYVDNAPVALSHARALLISGRPGTVGYVEADLRDTAAIFEGAAATLDFTKPVAVLLLIIVHLIPDADDPYGIVARLLEAMPTGSYLAIAHPASDIRRQQQAEMTRRVNAWMDGSSATMRDRTAIRRFFEGTDLIHPGLVQPQQWRPRAGSAATAQVAVWCGVGRKR